MSIATRLLNSNPSAQVSSLLTGSISIPSAGSAAFAGGYQNIATVSGSGTSVTFSNIPQTYYALEVRWVATDSQSSGQSTAMELTFNNSTTTSYWRQRMTASNVTYSIGGSTSAADNANMLSGASTSVSFGVMGCGILTIADYASTTKKKTFHIRQGIHPYTDTLTDSFYGETQGVYTLTTAITSIKFLTNGTSFNSPTTFSLYGWI